MQRRYPFIEIGTYFKSLGVKVPEAWDGPNSKRIYAAELLAMLPDDRIFEICEDLELSISTVASPVPKFWRDTNFLRLFISHISADKDKAVRLRECLLPYGISAFVAHEDIAPTLAWQVEIERALSHMHYFLSFHTAGFCQSNWTQQEIGFAVARKVKLLSLNMGEVPTGFIAREQAISRRARSAEEIAIEIRAILVDDKALSSFLQTESRSGDIPF